MKKIISIVSLILVGLISFMCFNPKNGYLDNEEYYAINESNDYIYQSNEYLCFNIYSNCSDSYLAYPDKNDYYLTYSQTRFILDNVSVIKIKQNKHFLYKVFASMPTVEYDLKNVEISLEVSNMKWKLVLPMGYLSIIHPNAQLLSIQNLFGTYSLINNGLYLVGVNIEFTNTFFAINSFKVGECGFGDLELLQNNFLDNEVNIKEVIPTYSYLYKREITYQKLLYSKLFIPLTYKSLLLIRKSYILVRLDNIDYYLDYFAFIANDVLFSDYQANSFKGELIYASNN